ncbi:phosphatidylethanolamine-binding protein [Chlamydoabsidia padenii]|nr:phosphatidylethanolamine-binding protein [Chlamydoabsidia padenii]
MPLITAEMNLQNAFKEAGLVPDVIHEGFHPETILMVKYGDQDVEMGNHLTTTQTSEAPQVQFFPGDEDAEYTLFLVDPDAPSRSDPKNGPWRHWVVTNIPGGQQAQVNASSTQLTNYMGPAPPPGSGDHRYIFLLYKQANKNNSFEALAQGVQDRRTFDFKQYAATNQLELVAANFFYCKS